MYDAGAKPLVTKLMEFVAERGLRPGDRLPSERELADRLGTGRNAVREAVAMLASLRVVEARPQSGIYLRELRQQSSFEALVLLSQLGLPPTKGEIAETMEVRATLERTAIELACARRDDGDLAALDRILGETAAVLAAKGNIAEEDNAFHLALVGAAHNAILVRVLNAFYELTLPRRRLYFARVLRGRASHRQHQQIVEAVRRRDAAHGIALMQTHMETARSYWRAELARR
jgi:GntR family transcriptional regulator, transcriptional repressor for pyruvate dehydrogenase complex